jgi:formamidopyrimidine-DNA glycosylase
MFELPEYLILARQINETLAGKVVTHGSLGNSPHKFVWYNRTREEFADLTEGKRVGEAQVQGRWLLVSLEPGYVLVLGECGGKVLYHASGDQLPAKYHLSLTFQDGSALSVTTQMWGAMELYERGQEQKRQYIHGMRPVPGNPAFTEEYFLGLIDELARGEKRSAKGLLTQEQLIPGLGNAIAQDILFRARLNPKRSIEALTLAERQRLFHAIVDTVADVTAHAGRNDEFDLFGQPGGYQRTMDRNAAGNPCPACGEVIEKIQYLGGACYFCPRCQPLTSQL